MNRVLVAYAPKSVWCQIKRLRIFMYFFLNLKLLLRGFCLPCGMRGALLDGYNKLKTMRVKDKEQHTMEDCFIPNILLDL